MNSNGKERDDLTAIKGIGRSRQQWLSKSFGVRTYQDLGGLSAADIETQLKAEGRIISRSEIDAWIAQARALAAEVQIVELEASEAGATANSPTAEGEWKPFASFVVEFQEREVEGQAVERRTSVHHMEADKGEVWAGVEGERLCQWMRDQVNGEMETMLETESVGKELEAKPLPVTVDISRIQLFQPPHAENPRGIGTAGHAFSGTVKGGELFALEASFELAGPGAEDFANGHITYSAQFHAHDRIHGSKTQLGETPRAALASETRSHSAALQEASLPPGVYHLWVFVKLHSTPPRVGFLEVPLLHVA